MSIDDEIARVSESRQREWNKGIDSDMELIAALSAELDALWQKKRETDAVGRHGNRETITKRARIEVELERMLNF